MVMDGPPRGKEIYHVSEEMTDHCPFCGMEKGTVSQDALPWPSVLCVVLAGLACTEHPESVCFCSCYTQIQGYTRVPRHRAVLPTRRGQVGLPSNERKFSVL